MARPSKSAIARAVLERHGLTHAGEAGIRVSNGKPKDLFQLLVLSLLLSARISSDNAVRAMKALKKAGFTTARKMADATWRQRVDVLNRNGYARYDERTSRMLGETSGSLLEHYGGDLRRLREDAGRDVEEERRLLKRYKGIGDVGADIFLREVQGVWKEVYPHADRRVMKAADRLGLGSDVKSLAKIVSRDEFVPLVAGMVRVDLEDAYDEVRRAAG